MSCYNKYILGLTAKRRLLRWGRSLLRKCVCERGRGVTWQTQYLVLCVKADISFWVCISVWGYEPEINANFAGIASLSIVITGTYTWIGSFCCGKRTTVPHLMGLRRRMPSFSKRGAFCSRFFLHISIRSSIGTALCLCYVTVDDCSILMWQDSRANGAMQGVRPARRSWHSLLQVRSRILALSNVHFCTYGLRFELRSAYDSLGAFRSGFLRLHL